VPVKVVHMPLISDVVCARTLLRSNFPSPGAQQGRTEPFLFDDGADLGAFGRSLKNKNFAWFLSIEDRLLARCVNLPNWVIVIRDVLRRLEASVTSKSQQRLWGEFLACQWVDTCHVCAEPGAPSWVYDRLPSEVYADAPHWTVELTRCPFEENWLSELLALASESPVEPKQVEPPLLEFGDGWVRIRGGEQVLVTDPKQLVILRVVYEQWEAAKQPTKKHSLIKTAKSKYKCVLSESGISRTFKKMLPRLKAMLRPKSGIGYEFIPPTDLVRSRHEVS
jgi:hypothetical protein